MEQKSPLFSKTLWVNLIGAVSALFIPSVQEWIAANPAMVATGWSVINMILRLVTKKEVSFY